MEDEQFFDSATLRRLAVEANADPRSVQRRIQGVPVRGTVSRRIDAVLRRHGIKTASPVAGSAAGSTAA